MLVLIASIPELKALADLGQELSIWTASIRWDGGPNTQVWLNELYRKIETYQAEYERLIGTSFDGGVGRGMKVNIEKFMRD